jgi:hypothetical protein
MIENMRCGDKIVTSLPPSWWSKSLSSGIIREQRKRGYARADGTHVLTFLGELPEIQAWLCYQKLREVGYKPGDYFTFSTCKDWCLSGTWPRTTLVHFADVMAKRHYRCYYRVEPSSLIGWVVPLEPRHRIFYAPTARGFMQEAAVELVGTHYDPGQLLDYLVNRDEEIPRSRWQRVFDLGAAARVCSVTAYLVEDIARQVMIDRHIETWVEPFTDYWGKPCKPDSILPADFENSLHYHCFAEVD